MSKSLPHRTRKYRSPVLNSDNWDLIVPRKDDIVISSAYKAGTTWTQTIVANLLFPDGNWPAPVMEIAPWVDRYRDAKLIDAVVEDLESQQHRRILKTHLPLDALPYYAQTKYIVVARDGRDVFMSLWNHHANYSASALEGFINTGRSLGMPWPAPSKDINEFYSEWIARSFFDWETEGFPYWSLFRHLSTWWAYRHLPNIHFVHYNELLNDLESQMRHIAAFLEIPVPDDAWSGIRARVSLTAMRANADRIMGKSSAQFADGAKTFFNEGTNGRWKPILSPEELTLYDAAVERNLTPDAAAWLATGKLS